VNTQRRTAVLWCALVLLVALYTHRNLIAAAGYLGPSPSDFFNYWAAAAAWVGGGSPYSVHNFDYPPLTAVAVLPLAALGYPAARAVWFAVGHLALLLGAVVVWRELGRNLESGVVVAAVWTLAGTVAANLVLGQINPILLLLVVLATAAMPRSRDGRAGAALGLATAFKVWPGALLWPAVVDHRWRAMVAGILVAVLGFVVPALALVIGGPPPYGPTSSGYWAGTPAFLNLSLPATALRLTDLPDLGRGMPASWTLGNNPEQFQLDGAHAVLSLVVAAAVVALGFIVIRRLQSPLTPWPAAVGAAVAVTLAAAPVSWYHYRLLHFPALAWLIATLLRQRRFGSAVAVVPLAIVLTWSHALHGDGPWTLALEPWSVLLRGFAVPAAELLFAWCLLQTGRRLQLHSPPARNGAGDTLLPGPDIVS
jgi:hypothetical protein